ncbi:MAG: hypothetical protein ACOCU5_01060 [Bacillota bacterium]
MPESRKRVKKNQEEKSPVYKNPLKKTWGKVVVLILVIAFLLGLVAVTAVVMWQVMFSS